MESFSQDKRKFEIGSFPMGLLMSFTGQVELLMTSQLVLKHPFHGTTEPFDDQPWLVSRYPFAGQVEPPMTERLASDISVYAKLCIYNTNRETTGKSLFNPHPNSHNGYPMDIQHTGTTSTCRMMIWITWYVQVNYSCCRLLGLQIWFMRGVLLDMYLPSSFSNLALFTSLSL